MGRALESLFAFLDGLHGRAALQDLQKRLDHLDVDVEELENFVKYSDRTYRRNLVRAGEWYNVWVLCWKNGQRSPIHDHRGSSCAVRVLDGTMTETLFTFAPNRHIKPLFSRDVGPGGVVGSEDTDIHQVSNLQAGDAGLVTLHVYSPPLAVMGTYSLLDDRRGEEPMFLEFVDAAGI
jgi:cysteine dioxygenase